MFGSIGMPELMIIFVIALIVFGPRKLPELGRSLGRSLSEFKRASNDLRNTLEEEIRIEDKKDKDKKPAESQSAQTTRSAEGAPKAQDAPPAADAPPAEDPAAASSTQQAPVAEAREPKVPALERTSEGG